MIEVNDSNWGKQITTLLSEDPLDETLRYLIGERDVILAIAQYFKTLEIYKTPRTEARRAKYSKELDSCSGLESRILRVWSQIQVDIVCSPNQERAQLVAVVLIPILSEKIEEYKLNQTQEKCTA